MFSKREMLKMIQDGDLIPSGTTDNRGNPQYTSSLKVFVKSALTAMLEILATADTERRDLTTEEMAQLLPFLTETAESVKRHLS